MRLPKPDIIRSRENTKLSIESNYIYSLLLGNFLIFCNLSITCITLNNLCSQNLTFRISFNFWVWSRCRLALTPHYLHNLCFPNTRFICAFEEDGVIHRASERETPQVEQQVHDGDPALRQPGEDRARLGGGGCWRKRHGRGAAQRCRTAGRSVTFKLTCRSQR